jgi:hypothetical protein
MPDLRLLSGAFWFKSIMVASKAAVHLYTKPVISHKWLVVNLHNEASMLARDRQLPNPLESI